MEALKYLSDLTATEWQGWDPHLGVICSRARAVSSVPNFQMLGKST